MTRLGNTFVIGLAIPFSFIQIQAASLANQSDVDGILARMSEVRAANRAHRRPFEVIRNYRLFGKKLDIAESEVTAHVSYLPPNGQSFTVHKDRGTSLGELIVRRILEHEKLVLADQAAGDISKENYAFRLLGQETRDQKPCFILEMKPSRKDPKLLVGKVWIDENTYLISRIEGEPSQPPSWWIHNIRLTLDFNVVHGMWVQSALESTANVRMLGAHTIVARDVEYKMGEIEVAVTKPTARQ